MSDTTKIKKDEALTYAKDLLEKIENNDDHHGILFCMSGTKFHHNEDGEFKHDTNVKSVIINATAMELAIAVQTLFESETRVAEAFALLQLEKLGTKLGSLLNKENSDSKPKEKKPHLHVVKTEGNA